MSWGSALKQAVNLASDQARQAAGAMVSSAEAAAAAAANMVGFAGRVAVDALGIAAHNSMAMAMSMATAPFDAALDLLAPDVSPRAALVEPCPNTWAGKKARLDKRGRLIKKGRDSPDTDTRQAAARLAKNNDAVELARLSNDAYAQCPPALPPTAPPAGWTVLDDKTLLDKGIDPQLMRDARAVMYETPDDWPGGKKTVLAFRGTADLADGIVDHDQAMGLDTLQYQSAVALGQDVRKGFGSDVLVTGHSLGGGKAQAAGAVGGLKGTMFNSAGLNPDSVNGKMPKPSQFTQYRTTADPLTGVQNSPALQAAVVGVVGPIGGALGSGMKAGDAILRYFGASGLPPDVAGYADKAFKALPRSLRNLAKTGSALPAAVGAVHQVPAIDAAGDVISPLRPDLQHSILSVINGIEVEKAEDIAALGG